MVQPRKNDSSISAIYDKIFIQLFNNWIGIDPICESKGDGWWVKIPISMNSLVRNISPDKEFPTGMST